MNESHEVLLKLGQRIASVRREKGLSLRDLARIAEISKGNLSDIERGKRDPRYSTLAAISGGLGITLIELLNGF